MPEKGDSLKITFFYTRYPGTLELLEPLEPCWIDLVCALREENNLDLLEPLEPLELMEPST